MLELQPQLHELLRTLVHPPSLLLEIAQVELLHLNQDGSDAAISAIDAATETKSELFYAWKLLLTDGQLMIQGLLHRKLSSLRGAAHIEVGDGLDIRQFQIKKSPRINGRGRVIYLAIEDCTFLLSTVASRLGAVQAEQESNAVDIRKRKRSFGESPDNEADLHGISNGQVASTGWLRSSPSKMLKTEGKVTKKSPLQPEPNVDVRALDDALETASDEDVQISQDLQSPTRSFSTKEHARADPSTVDRRIKNSSGKGATHPPLDNTFGARRLLLDEGDEDEFFESIQSLRTPGRKPQPALHDDGCMPLGVDVDMAVSRLEPISIATLKPTSPTCDLSALRKETNEHSEPQVPQLPILGRDGILRFSQILDQPSRNQDTLQAPHLQESRIKIIPSSVQPSALTQVQLLPSPPFHNLRSLRKPSPDQPLPSKNYMLTTLAFISWTGTALIQPSGSAFPPKRHLKIIDPSLSSAGPQSRDAPLQALTNSTRPVSAHGVSSLSTFSYKPQTAFQHAVTVAVYIDAANFKPVQNTLALFRGLVMQRLRNGDIILNAYGRLKDQRFQAGPEAGTDAGVAQAGMNTAESDAFGHWFITDHEQIRALGQGSRLDYLLEWWNSGQRNAQTQG